MVVRTSPDQPSFVRINGKPAGEFAAGTKGQPPHTIKVRWKQSGGVIGGIVVELDEQKIEADGGFSFAAPKVLFGGRGRFNTPDYEPGKVNCLNILRLEYIKE